MLTVCGGNWTLVLKWCYLNILLHIKFNGWASGIEFQNRWKPKLPITVYSGHEKIMLNVDPTKLIPFLWTSPSIGLLPWQSLPAHYFLFDYHAGAKQRPSMARVHVFLGRWPSVSWRLPSTYRLKFTISLCWLMEKIKFISRLLVIYSVGNCRLL